MSSICKLCDKHKKLIKAHIIPESFFKYTLEDNDDPKIYSQDDYTRKSKIGIYDKNILCKDCDSQIGLYDEYAKKLLLDQKHQIEYNSYGNFIKINNFDYHKLMLFLLSMLWRASISSQKYYSSIKLEESYELILKKIIKTEKFDSNKFLCLLEKYYGPLSNNFKSPREVKDIYGIYYCFSFTGYNLFIKIDGLPFHKDYEKYLIQPNKPIYINYSDFNKTNEARKLADFVNKNIFNK